MMERLTEKQSAGYDLIEMQGKYCEEHCRHQDHRTCRNCAIYKAIQKLAHYEDLEEQGLLITLPCDRVYFIVDLKTRYATIMSRNITDLTMYEICKIDKDGRFFSTKEKAERELAKLKGLKNE